MVCKKYNGLFLKYKLSKKKSTNLKILARYSVNTREACKKT